MFAQRRTRGTGGRLTKLAVACLVAWLLPSAGAVGAACLGDCDSDGQVTVDEIVRGVNIALGQATTAACPALDGNADAAITIEELVGAVNSALLGCAAPTPTPTESVLNIVLGRPTDTSVSASVLADAGTEVFFEYGAAPGSYTGRTDVARSSAGEPIVIEIGDLKTNTRYYYRPSYRRQGEAEYRPDAEHSFHTRRLAGSTFSFGVQGDSHPEREGNMFDPDLYALNMRNAAARQPDFYFGLGDDFSIERLIDTNTLTQQNVDQAYLKQRGFFGIVGNSTPVFLVNGNHEQAAGYLLGSTYETPYDNAPIYAGKARVTYFALPAADGFYSADPQEVPGVGLIRDYYAWEWGDALFVTIDPYWHSPVPVDNGVPGVGKASDPWEITMGDAQYAWFKQTLEQSRAKYKFVFEHHVLGGGRGAAKIVHSFEWGGYDRNGQVYEFATKRPGWAKPVHQLMVENKVTIFFSGHDHLFAREKVDEVVYQSVPNPADNTYTAFNRDAYAPAAISFPGASYDPGYGVTLPNCGYLHVTVAPENVTVSYVRAVLPGEEAKAGSANGEVAFAYSVSADQQGTTSPTITPTPGDTRAPTPSRTPTPTALPPTAPPVGEVFSGGELLGRPTDTSVTVNAVANQSVEVYFELGTEPGTYTWQTAVTTAAAETPFEVALTGLLRDTRYYYRMRYRTPGAAQFERREQHSFHTQRAPGSPFTFTVQADPHLDSNTDTEVYQRTLSNVLADGPDFHIDLGDTFMSEKFATDYAGTVERHRMARAYYDLVGHSAPLFLTLGNHEGELGWLLDGTADNLAVWASAVRTNWFPNPVPDGFYTGNGTAEPFVGLRQNYYAWPWGDALFVVLDPYWYTTSNPNRSGDDWDWTLGDEQYSWLKGVLESSGARFKFVFAHQLVGGFDSIGRGGAEAAPYYEWGGKNADGSWGFDRNRHGWAMPIHQLLVQNHVAAFFHGHDHLFVKQDLDGVVYQEVPQPGNLKGGTSSAVAYGYLDGVLLGSSGHLRVTVSPTAATVDYVRAYRAADENATHVNRSVDYSYTLAGDPCAGVTCAALDQFHEAGTCDESNASPSR